ncbi:MAG: response regulator transcription factor [Chloroflexi bacterium]|nr:response regulator transcription factor [Chloroflexota bacterium]
MHPTLCVLVFDDETFVRKQLRKLLSAASDIRLVGEMTELSQFLTHCLVLQPQVVLLGSGLKPFIFDLAAATHQVAPQAKMIALLNEHEPLRAEALLATNLAGCLFRQEINDHLLPTIYAVTQGAVAFSRAVMARMVAAQLTNPPTEPKEPVTPPGLTQREQDVLRLLALGLSNKAIARELCLTEGTIEQHLKRIYRKLNVNTRVEAATWFLRFQG